LITRFRAGDSLLHKLGAGPKLIGLLVLVTFISVVGDNQVFIVGGLILAFLLYLIAFVDKSSGYTSGLNEFALALWRLKWLIAVVFVPQLFFVHLLMALLHTGRVIDAVLLASVFSATTKNADLIRAIEIACRPLARLGVRAETVSLVFAMTVNAIPMVIQFVANVKEAQQARGLRPRIALMAVPVLVASLKYADDFSEALLARGVEI
jgi:biotin transport system permease protein